MRSKVQVGMLALALGVATPGARCGDGSRTEVSEGEVLGDSAYQAIDYTLTSDNYRKWLVAEKALDSVGLEDRVRVDVRRVSDDDVDRVVESIESQPKARAAIESADMSVRDFVLTSIALAQSWDASNQPGVRVTGLPRNNLEFIRAQSSRDSVLSVRPTPRFSDDDDLDDDRGHHHRARGHDRDKDDDGNRGRGRGRGKEKRRH